MKASFEDLERELWFRWRNRGIIVWENEDGTKVPIKDMKLSDLLTAMRYSKKTQIDNPFDDPINNPFDNPINDPFDND